MRISVIPSIRNNQRGFLLRWLEKDDTRGPAAPLVKASHWFADREEALIVRGAMRAGQSFDAAERLLWA